MVLSQTKLNFVEWNSIEVPVSSDELTILDIISKGYHDINVIHNTLPSLYSLLKLQPNDDLDAYLYNKYLKINIDGSYPAFIRFNLNLFKNFIH